MRRAAAANASANAAVAAALAAAGVVPRAPVGFSGFPPPPSRSAVEHPSVKVQFALAKATLEATGIPASGGPCNWTSFSNMFKEIPYPADNDAATLIADRISRELAATVSSFRLLKGATERKRRTEPRSAQGRVSGRDAAYAPAPDDAAEEEGRSSSPTPSAASSRAGDASTAKRLRTAEAVEEAAALAAVKSQGHFFNPDETWPRDVRCFLPELGAAVLASKHLASSVAQALQAAFVCSDEDPLCLDADSFSQLTPVIDTRDIDVFDGNSASALEHIRLLQKSIAALNGSLVASRASMTRCFDLYKLACMTKGANWLTVQQLQFRERADRSQAVFDSHSTPLVSWEDKTRAALIACDQTHTMNKEGKLLGPVCPAVALALARPPRGPGPAGGAQAASGGGRAFAAGACKRKGGNKPPTPAGGAKNGQKKRSRPPGRNGGGKKASAGADAPTLPAAGNP